MEVFTTIDRKVSKYLQGDGIYIFSRTKVSQVKIHKRDLT